MEIKRMIINLFDIEKGVSLLLLFSCICLTIAFIVFDKYFQNVHENEINRLLDDDFVDDKKISYRMILCVRTDLAMSRQILFAQCAHAAVGAYELGMMKNPCIMAAWQGQGQKKSMIQLHSEESLLQLELDLKKSKLSYYVARNLVDTSSTVIAVGPACKQELHELVANYPKYE